MGKQYNKVIKRRRRMAYNVRKVAAQAAAVKAKTSRPRPVRSSTASPAAAPTGLDDTTNGAAPAPAKRVRKPKETKEPKAPKAGKAAAPVAEEGSETAAEAAPTTPEGNEV